MKIHLLQTGTVEVKDAFLHAGPGPRGRMKLLLPGPFAPPIPIHVCLIEHAGQRILVDTGEVATAKDLPFARYHVKPTDELPHVLEPHGVTPAELDTVILTHLHGDHHDGAVHVPGPVLVSDLEWRAANGRVGRIAQRLTRAPIPAGSSFSRSR